MDFVKSTTLLPPPSAEGWERRMKRGRRRRRDLIWVEGGSRGDEVVKRNRGITRSESRQRTERLRNKNRAAKGVERKIIDWDKSIKTERKETDFLSALIFLIFWEETSRIQLGCYPHSTSARPETFSDRIRKRGGGERRRDRTLLTHLPDSNTSIKPENTFSRLSVSIAALYQR